MPRHEFRFTFTILNGATLSNEFKGPEARVALGSLTDATLYSPATLPETVTVQIAPFESPVTGDYEALSVAGADVTALAAKAKQIAAGLAGAKAMRLSAGVAVAADRVFQLLIQMDVGSALGGF